MVKPGYLVVWVSAGLLGCWAGAVYGENYIDVDFGVAYSKVSESEPSPADGDFDSGEVGYHLGVGAYRNTGDSPWVYGVKLELQDVVGNSLISVRAIDLGYKFTSRFTLNGYLGGARYDLATPAFGYRFGIGGRYWMSDRLALSAEGSFADSVARDKLLPEEPPGNSPDLFFDVFQLNLYLKYKF
jgi:hypothetical protein